MQSKRDANYLSLVAKLDSLPQFLFNWQHTQLHLYTLVSSLTAGSTVAFLHQNFLTPFF